MTNIYQLCEMVQKELEANRIYCEVYPSLSGDKVNVEISWGDWKHDHLRTNWIVANIGGELVSQWTTEEDESDCYSGIHQFKFA